MGIEGDKKKRNCETPSTMGADESNDTRDVDEENEVALFDENELYVTSVRRDPTARYLCHAKDLVCYWADEGLPWSLDGPVGYQLGDELNFCFTDAKGCDVTFECPFGISKVLVGCARALSLQYENYSVEYIYDTHRYVGVCTKCLMNACDPVGSCGSCEWLVCGPDRVVAPAPDDPE